MSLDRAGAPSTNAAEEPSGESIRQLVRNVWGDLSPSQQRCARVLLDGAAEVAFLTSAQLAGRSDVSESTVVRFAQSLGFRGYPDFQAALRTSVRAAMEPADRMRVTRSTGTTTVASSTSPYSADLENISDLAAKDQSEVVNEVAREIAQAKHVFTAGTRSSLTLAEQARFLLMQMRDGVERLTPDEPERFDRLEPGDVVIAFTLPRYSRSIFGLCTQLVSQGASLCVVADSETAPLAPTARHLLIAPCLSRSFFNSNTTAVMLLNAITTQVAEELGTAALDKLERNTQRAKGLKLHM